MFSIQVPRFAALLVAGCALLASPLVHADERNSALVSFLEGSATNSTGGSGSATPLALNKAVFENDVVETAPGAKLELKLKDGSVIRLGPASKLQLKSAYFGKQGEKKFSAKLMFGRVWSKVTGLVGGDSKFEVETDNAVAGVRGTTFRVDASTDRSVLVRVYSGAVAMGPGGRIPRPETKGHRKQISGPKQIDKNTWEKLVGKMMEMHVSADGTPSDPTAFAAKDDAGDEWAQWNTERDEEKK
jgi:ferric-dicitrate binding protein FerR (iron transport regulator)